MLILGGSLSLKTTPVQAHRGFRLLTLASWYSEAIQEAKGERRMIFWGGGFEVVFMLVFLAIAAMIVVTMICGIGEWHKNNESPRLTVDAEVVAKRTRTDTHCHDMAGDPTGAHGTMHTTSTSYFAAFQVESGDRMEFSVTGSEYGMLAERDRGKLSFQGTRYLGFERR